MGPCTSKSGLRGGDEASSQERYLKDMKVANGAPIKLEENVAGIFAIAEPRTPPPEPQLQSTGLKDSKQAELDKGKNDPRYNPSMIVCEPASISRALKENSDAVKFSTEHPNLELRSPCIQASF